MSQYPLAEVSWKSRNSRWMSCPVIYQPRSDVSRSKAVAAQRIPNAITPSPYRRARTANRPSRAAIRNNATRLVAPVNPLFSRMAPATATTSARTPRTATGATSRTGIHRGPRTGGDAPVSRRSRNASAPAVSV